jgi:steroid 5-alpha reductase family enzyme
MVLIGWALMFAVMTALWFIQRAKGDAQREYQRTTGAFVPWIPKKG